MIMGATAHKFPLFGSLGCGKIQNMVQQIGVGGREGFEGKEGTCCLGFTLLACHLEPVLFYLLSFELDIVLIQAIKWEHYS